jgi:hypothetical protein
MRQGTLAFTCLKRDDRLTGGAAVGTKIEYPLAVLDNITQQATHVLLGRDSRRDAKKPAKVSIGIPEAALVSQIAIEINLQHGARELV